ncbi:MAG: ATP-binding protein [Candidatus Saccharibacteria bacterium]|nr:ATP-binding protein [Candidatus Saccharibacteria bacterium]
MQESPKPPRKTVQSAELERERLTSLVNSMADGVIAIDDQLDIVVSNGAALNILDVNATVNGKSIADFLRLVDKNGEKVDIKKFIQDVKTPYSTRDWRVVYGENDEINVYVSIAPVRLGFGQEGMHGYVILLRDITREKSLEEERDEFISVVSHELRTPVTIAEGNIGNMEFLLEKNGIEDKMLNEAVSQAHTQITFLAGLINDLATLSRAERGKLHVEVESINVHELIDDLVGSYKADAEKKGLQLKNEQDPNLELLRSSRLYVREILQNFITNSIKYTQEGSVLIGASQKAGGVEFYVTDTGIGMSKADKEKVFDKFFRSEDFRTRANSGTGLGLYVTMKLSRLVRADISVESELNKGSTFSIYFPNLQPENTPQSGKTDSTPSASA